VGLTSRRLTSVRVETEVVLMTFEELPEMLRVEEAAELLRISRSGAYQGVTAFQASGGSVGIPSIRVGRCVRVPKRALLQWLDDQLPDLRLINESDDDAA
jgi:hypothetical protein